MNDKIQLSNGMEYSVTFLPCENGKLTGLINIDGEMVRRSHDAFGYDDEKAREKICASLQQIAELKWHVFNNSKF